MAVPINILESFLEHRFGLRGNVEKLEGGLTNENYVLACGEGEYIVKLSSGSVDERRFESELEILSLLSDDFYYPVPKFCLGRSGAFREIGEGLVCSCYQKLPGEHRYRIIDLPHDVKAVGRCLGLLHQKFFKKREYEESFRSPLFQYFVTETSWLASELKELEDEIQRAGCPVIPIHGDFQQSNLLYSTDGEICAIIDFEYASRDYRIMEIAMTLSNLLSAGGGEEQIVEEFLLGYKAVDVEPVSECEQSFLPRLIQCAWELNRCWALKRLGSNTSTSSIASVVIQDYLKQTAKMLEARQKQAILRATGYPS